MNRLSPSFLLRLAVFCAAFTLVSTHAQNAQPAAGPLPAPADRLVVLISVDGLASYYLDDPKAHMPTLRRLAREGASAQRMKCALPTVTWPNHTTLVTGVSPGKHGVIANSFLDRTKNEIVPLIPDPLFDKAEIVKAPTVYDLAFQAGLKTAGIIWPATRNAQTLHWQMPDVFSNSLFQAYSTPQLLKELREAGIPVDMQETWCKTPGSGGVERDWMYARSASHVIRKHKPNLLLLHLIEADHVQHNTGPRGPDAYWACSYSDDRVRDIVEASQETFPGRATIVVCSDHGFIPYRQQIQANVVLKRAGLLDVRGAQIHSARARALAQGGCAFVYVLDAAQRATVLEKAVESFRNVEGIEQIIETKDFAQHGLVPPDRDPRMADLVLTAKEGYTFSDTAAGDIIVTPPSEQLKGAHGHSPEHPLMYGTFIAWGAGIKPGTKLTEVRNTDVAPTLARLLGVPMRETDGRALDEILVPTSHR